MKKWTKIRAAAAAIAIAMTGLMAGCNSTGGQAYPPIPDDYYAD